MGKVGYRNFTTTKLGLNAMGIAIFGGTLIASFVDSNKYSSYDLWEFRFFIAGSAAIYYLIVYLYHRRISNHR